jgi:glucose/arabinose dehydrogenase
MKSVKYSLYSLIVLAIALSSFCARKQTGQLRLVPDSDNGGLTLPDGFSAIVMADKLGHGRHITVKSNGDVYLALSSLKDGKGIAALRDINGDGRADSIVFFGNTVTTGIEYAEGFLFYSNSTQVFRVALSENELVPRTEPVLIASGFPEQGQHQDKTFTLDGAGNIYVNVGAPTNACQVVDRTPGSPGIDPCPQLEQHAGIWRFRADLPAQDQVANGHRYASGIRNSIALTWNNSNNKLYVVQHGRDQLSQLYPDLYTEQQGADLPAEEFLMVEDGDFFGWPYCYYDQISKQKLLAPEYGGDTKATGRCSDAKLPIMGFPGHYAPNALLFYTGSMFPERYKNGAFIAFHGSWNRAPLEQKGYMVAFVPFNNGLPSGEMEVFADGFAGVKTLQNPADAVYRPTGLAQGPDGSIYVSDTEKGRIWKIIYNKK